MLDGTSTRLSHKVGWKQHIPNEELQRLQIQVVKGVWSLVEINGGVNKKLCIKLFCGIQIMGQNQEVDKQESSSKETLSESEEKNRLKRWTREMIEERC